jgi:hypothetical protein
MVSDGLVVHQATAPDPFSYEDSGQAFQRINKFASLELRETWIIAPP